MQISNISIKYYIICKTFNIFQAFVKSPLTRFTNSAQYWKYKIVCKIGLALFSIFPRKVFCQ